MRAPAYRSLFTVFSVTSHFFTVFSVTGHFFTVFIHADETIFSSHLEDNKTKSSPTPQFTHVHGLSLASPLLFPFSCISIHCCLPATAVWGAQFLAYPILRPRDRWEPGPFYCKRWPIPKPPFGPATSLLLGLETGALLLRSQDQEVVMIPVQPGRGPWGNSPVLKSHVGGFVDRYWHRPTAQISMLQVLLFSVRRRRHTSSHSQWGCAKCCL